MPDEFWCLEKALSYCANRIKRLLKGDNSVRWESTKLEHPSYLLQKLKIFFGSIKKKKKSLAGKNILFYKLQSLLNQRPLAIQKLFWYCCWNSIATSKTSMIIFSDLVWFHDSFPEQMKCCWRVGLPVGEVCALYEHRQNVTMYSKYIHCIGNTSPTHV